MSDKLEAQTDHGCRSCPRCGELYNSNCGECSAFLKRRAERIKEHFTTLEVSDD